MGLDLDVSKSVFDVVLEFHVNNLVSKLRNDLMERIDAPIEIFDILEFY